MYDVTVVEVGPVNVDLEGVVQFSLNCQKLSLVEELPDDGFSMLTKLSGVPATGPVVPSTSAGKRLWPRNNGPKVAGYWKHCGGSIVVPLSMLERSKAQATAPTS